MCELNVLAEDIHFTFYNWVGRNNARKRGVQALSGANLSQPLEDTDNNIILLKHWYLVLDNTPASSSYR